MAASNEGVLRSPDFIQVQALAEEQARLECERPAAASRGDGDADAFPSLEDDQRRAVVESLIEAVVVAKAERRGWPRNAGQAAVRVARWRLALDERGGRRRGWRTTGTRSVGAASR